MKEKNPLQFELWSQLASDNSVDTTQTISGTTRQKIGGSTRQRLLQLLPVLHNSGIRQPQVAGASLEAPQRGAREPPGIVGGWISGGWSWVEGLKILNLSEFFVAAWCINIYNISHLCSDFGWQSLDGSITNMRSLEDWRLLIAPWEVFCFHREIQGMGQRRSQRASSWDARVSALRVEVLNLLNLLGRSIDSMWIVLKICQ